MVCPMRFLLVGASAVVAVLGVVYTCQSSEPAMNVKLSHGKRVNFGLPLLKTAQ